MILDSLQELHADGMMPHSGDLVPLLAEQLGNKRDETCEAARRALLGASEVLAPSDVFRRLAPALASPKVRVKEGVIGVFY